MKNVCLYWYIYYKPKVIRKDDFIFDFTGLDRSCLILSEHCIIDPRFYKHPLNIRIVIITGHLNESIFIIYEHSNQT